MPDRVADELAIRGLTAHYNHMADQLRGADCAAAFTENGVLEAAGRLEGRAAIAAFFDAQAHGEPVDIGFGKTGHLFSTVHATTDNVITIEGDRATQMSYMLVFRQVPREMAQEGLYVITHRWDDRLVRTDAGWLFEHRIMNVLQTNANPDATAQNLRLPTHP
ncbi:nuclear transport factor 2 family protein [Streptomyces sp. NPDC002838]|uniref:nuclear transport factor 2 family protein n=1 Tax=Streptomyces sp. NPDC002838 TaxID=3154436 RepID=UPI00332D8BBF